MFFSSPGNYQYPVVRHVSSTINRRQNVVGFNNTAVVTLQCGTNLNVKVDHSKTGSVHYQTLNDSVSVPTTVNLTTVWSSTTVGDHYVQFKVKDAKNYEVYDGVWINTVAAASHQVKVRLKGRDW